MNPRRHFALALLFAAAPLFAAQNTTKPAPAAPNGKAPAVSGFRAEFLANLDDVQQKILSLAEITPADKFSWRPAPGVRSISEV
ncbi:MAG TPA: hypothetical protein VFO89_10670, partial [Thermoanaerobaculia bacterium]|nr:hypothetical protein [Thermoanaerobaculia bacterium]